MKNKLILEHLLKEWGKAYHELPENDETLKSKILSKVSPKREENIGLTHHYLPWIPLVLGGLAVLTIFLDLPQRQGVELENYGLETPIPTVEVKSHAVREKTGNNYVRELMPASPAERFSQQNEVSTGDIKKMVAPNTTYDYPILPPSPEIPIADKREFIKKEYRATIRTRRTEELTSRIQSLIRGSGGRVDDFSSSERYGYIKFVMPADQFETFRLNVKGLTLARFFAEEISAKNLLPQKQFIETQERAAADELSTVTKERATRVTAYLRIIDAIQKEVDAFRQELSVLNAATSTDPLATGRKQELLKKITDLNTRLTDENVSYNQAIKTLDDRKQFAENNLEVARKTDIDLIATVDTVRGVIVLNWVSIAGVIGLFLPSYWLPVLLGFSALILYVRHRRKEKFIII